MIDEAISELKKGKMILLHDSGNRENEVDMVTPAQAVTPETIRTLRKDAGGLICLAIGKEIADKLSLPYMTDLMTNSNDVVKKLVPEKTAYGDKPAFSLSVNHRDTFTGVTDKDRALTITKFAGLESPKELVENFYAPGHVHLLIAKSLVERRGHTELSVELAKRANIKEAMVLCEMMADDHGALSLEDAKKYSNMNGLILLDGGDV